MNKDIDEFYKKYSARVTEVDDTPLFATGTFGSFKMLSTEEYEKLVNENKLLTKALELACEELENVEVFDKEFMGCECFEDYFKQQAEKEMKDE